jgi:glycosyltransferase involved in cell wall biosynthesis
MKHVLILTPEYEPAKGGVGAAAKVMACGLVERGYQVTVGTAYHPDRGPEIPGENPSVKQFKVSGSGNLREGFCGEVSVYQEFVATFPGDFIICHAWQTWSTDLAIPVFSRTRAKKVFTSHGFSAHLLQWHDRFPWGLGQWLGWQPYVARLPFFLRRFSRVVFLSKLADWHRFFDNQVARLTGYRGIAVIPNGVDATVFDKPLPDFRREFGIEEGCMFLCVANYCTRKNQELALRAFRKARIAGATLVFIGSEFNEYRTMLCDLDQQLAKSHPGGRVLFLEKINREMTLAAFKACSAFVLTSEDETQPIVLLESMACGKPFISTESSGCISELDGGFVVHTEQETSDKMKYLSEHPEVRATLGRAGKQDVLAHYTHKRVVDAYDELLCSLT